MSDEYVKQYISDVKIKNHNQLRIGFLGGSLTKGEGVKKDKSFLSIFQREISQVMGNGTEIDVISYGESGTLSANGLFRIPSLIEEHPDLVFIDYAMNDPGDRYLCETMEGIVYQLMEAGVAVVILLFCNHRGMCTRGGMEQIAMHYHIPVYDIGQKIYARVSSGEITWQDYAFDYVHPTEWGHRCIADYLLDLFGPWKVDPIAHMDLVREPAFTGAFRHTSSLNLSTVMHNAKPGDIIYDEELFSSMILMEFYQDHEINHASAVIRLDGKVVTTADAYASMAWGNRVSRYIGGDGDFDKHRLTVTLSKDAPPEGWDYSMLSLHFLLGVRISKCLD